MTDNVPRRLSGSYREAKSTHCALTFYSRGELQSVYTYRQLFFRVREVVTHLEGELGLSPGDRLATMCGNSADLVVLDLAALCAGIVLVPIPPDESVAMTTYFVRHSGARVLVADDVAGVAPAVRDSIPVLSVEKLTAVEEPSSIPSVQPWLDEKAAVRRADDLAVLLYTSGTTGPPKGVSLRHGNLLANSDGLRDALSLRSSSRHMCVLPLYHANAFGFSLVCTLTVGASLILHDGPPVLGAAGLIAREHIEVLSAVPQIIRMLCMDPSMSRSTLPTLRVVTSAAAPLSQELADRFETTTGLKIYHGYGLSECTNFATMVRADTSEDVRRKVMSEERVPSVGSALPQTEVEVVDESGQLAPEGVIGEVVVDGDHVTSGYWNDEASTRSVLTGGRLRTGDLGFWRLCDDRKYFYLTGRKKELILRGGENVSPRLVEDEIGDLGVPIAVAGFAHQASGEEIALYVEGDPSAGLVRLIEDRLRTFPARRRPKVVMIGPEPIPRTSTGKVRRSEVSRWFSGYEDARLGGENAIYVGLDGRQFRSEATSTKADLPLQTRGESND